MKKLFAVPLFVVFGLLVPFFAHSQSAPPSAAAAVDPQEAALTAATEAARKVLREGPQDVALIDQAVLKLPADFGFIPGPEATQYLRAIGNPSTNDVAGLVVPLGEAASDWLVVVDYTPSGYIKDDDAKAWNADELLESLRAGTEEENKAREKLGISGLEILGWVEKPTYDESARRLIWSIAARDTAAAADADNGINYNTYALGREGYFTLNLLTSQSAVMQDKPAVHALLSGLQFNEGKRYADFNPDTDTVAEYGLAALVAGVAAKKMGLLAAIAVFFAKFWKLLALGAVGLGAAATRLFKKKD